MMKDFIKSAQSFQHIFCSFAPQEGKNAQRRDKTMAAAQNAPAAGTPCVHCILWTKYFVVFVKMNQYSLR